MTLIRYCRRSVVLPLLTGALAFGTAESGAQQAGTVLLRQLYGDLAFDIRMGTAGAVQMGIADSTRSVTITVLARDLQLWADSVNRILSARPPRRNRKAEWNATVRGPGVAAGTMALTRNVNGKDTTTTLLVTDADFMAVRTRLSTVEARSLMAAMRRVAKVATSRKPRSGAGQ